jgi:hypothetical protein
MLKQIGMTASAVENYPAVFCINTVYKEPVRFNMTLPFPFIFPMQEMVLVFGEQGLFINKQSHYISKFVHVPVTLLHQLAVFFEGTGKRGFQHGSIVRIQIRHHFIKGVVPLGRYLSTEHGITFFKGGDSFGVKTLFSGYRVAVRGADRTFTAVGKPVVISGSGFGREGKDNRPRRNFAGNVNSQPVAVGHFYGLGNCHKENIA